MPDDVEWTFIARLAAGQDAERSAVELCKLLIAESGAERAFVVLEADRDAPRVIAADLDGLRLSDAEQRLDAAVVEAALTSGLVHHGELVTGAGAGSRLAAASPTGDAPRAAIVIEHRFLPGRFDALRRERVERWAALAALVGRVSGGPRAAPMVGNPSNATARFSAPPEPSTVLPGRGRRRSFPQIVGASAALERALERLDVAVDSDLPVLIGGETGVGKELFARALHDHGPRAKKAFVAINCGAVPDALFEAELFGHVRGSFTGADRARPGLLSQAEGGTLLLDEIGELPQARQASLLRVLATRRYRPVGSDEEKSFDVRIVAASNRDLSEAARQGEFRQDLLYRLNVLEIQVPALRERPEDVVLIARHVIERAGSRAVLSPEAGRALEAHEWPGNVRELEHQIQRVLALGVDRIEFEHLSREVRSGAGRSVAPPGPRAAPAGAPDEAEAVQAALHAAGGNITRAARRLGMTRQGLKKKMVRLGLREANVPTPPAAAKSPAGKAG